MNFDEVALFAQKFSCLGARTISSLATFINSHSGRYTIQVCAAIYDDMIAQKAL